MSYGRMFLSVNGQPTAARRVAGRWPLVVGCFIIPAGRLFLLPKSVFETAARVCNRWRGNASKNLKSAIPNLKPASRVCNRWRGNASKNLKSAIPNLQSQI